MLMDSQNMISRLRMLKAFDTGLQPMAGERDPLWPCHTFSSLLALLYAGSWRGMLVLIGART